MHDAATNALIIEYLFSKCSTPHPHQHCSVCCSSCSSCQISGRAARRPGNCLIFPECSSDGHPFSAIYTKSLSFPLFLHLFSVSDEDIDEGARRGHSLCLDLHPCASINLSVPENYPRGPIQLGVNVGDMSDREEGAVRNFRNALMHSGHGVRTCPPNDVSGLYELETRELEKCNAT